MDRHRPGQGELLSHEHPNPAQRPEWYWAAWMAVLVAVPATFALWSAPTPPKCDTATHPTPFGYTWSLLLFLVPLVALVVWVWKRRDLKAQRRAVKRTLPILIAQGFGLDLLFGGWFFKFPNEQAVLRWKVPVVGGGWVPVEEFIFYASGYAVILLLYVWCDEVWLARYNISREDYQAGVHRAGRLMRFHKESLWVGFALLGVAVACWWVLADPRSRVWPGYLTFLIFVAFVPSLGFFAAVKRYINWQAVSLTFFVLVLVSMLWEVTLAIPYGWWDYNWDLMLGVPIHAWRDLPLEAVLVWMAATYSTVIWYEVIKLWQCSGQPARTAFLAIRKPSGPPPPSSKAVTTP